MAAARCGSVQQKFIFISPGGTVLLLTDEEVIELTGRQKREAQRKVLSELSIPFRIRPDGTLVVLRAAMEVALGHAPTNKKQTSPAMRL